MNGFFASRGMELLPLRRNVIQTQPDIKPQDLYTQLVELRQKRHSWAHISQLLGSKYSPDELSHLYHSRQPYKSVVYLNVDQFNHLQSLVQMYGEDWPRLSQLLQIQAYDLEKNWRGYSLHTKITSIWQDSECLLLGFCRALGVCCRTSALIIGTKLPLQCRRKNLKDEWKPIITTQLSGQNLVWLADKRHYYMADSQLHAVGVNDESMEVLRSLVQLAGMDGVDSLRLVGLARQMCPKVDAAVVGLAVVDLLSKHRLFAAGQQHFARQN